MVINLLALATMLVASPISKRFNAVVSDEVSTQENYDESYGDSYDVSFSFGTETICDDILSFTVTADFPGVSVIKSDGNIGISVLSKTENEIRFEAELPDDDGEVTIVFSFDGKEETRKLYSTSDDEGRYAVSVFSLYSAKKLLGTLPNQEYMDNNSIEAEYQEPNIVSTNNGARRTKAKGGVSGTILWTDDSFQQHPLSGAEVKLTFSNSSYSCYTYLDSNGFFNLGFSGGEFTGTFGCTLHIYTENLMVKVTDKYSSLYEKAIPLSDMQNNTDYYLGTYVIDSSDDTFVEACQIFSAGKHYSDYAYTLTESLIDQCKFVYPSSSDNCYYTNNTDTLYIVDKTRYNEAGYPKSYACWDVIGHEYGHHLQYHYFYQEYYGDHYRRKNDIYTYFETMKGGNASYVVTNEELIKAKQQALGLSFKEAWPTFFSISAQYFFDSDTQRIPTVGDSIYTSYMGFERDLELQNNPYGNQGEVGGETDEQIIMSFLYQLWDSDNTNSNDILSIADYDLWQIMVDNNPATLADFVSALYNSSLTFSRNSLGLLLEGFDLSSSSLSMVVELEHKVYFPSYTWSAGGADVTFDGVTYSYSNDKFRLHFYDEDKNEIVTTEYVADTTYALSLEQWKTISFADGDYYYVVIESYATFGYETGPYYSSYQKLKKPDSITIRQPIIGPSIIR